MYRRYVKRIIDFLLAIILLVTLSPVFLIISIAIKMESKGPIIFKQIRSGKNNKEFILYKFRSMKYNNDIYNIKEEDQVTSVGSFLRKTSLDELPQLINIIKGDMSFIGPRPWVVDYAKFFTKKQMRRLDVLPGITGLAQCSGRNNLTIQQRIKIDLKYVNNISLKLDLIIIIKTIKCILIKEGVSNTKSAIHEEINRLKHQHKKSYLKYLEKQEELNKITKTKKNLIKGNFIGSEI